MTRPMTNPLRVSLIAITVALLITTFLQGTMQGRILVARLIAPSLDSVELLGMQTVRRAAPAPMIERARTDLTVLPRPEGAARRYAPQPGQGDGFRTRSGLRWWGAAPERADAMPAVLLLHAEGQDGRSMIDMWHEVAMTEGLILIAPDLVVARDGVRPYDARIAAEALAQARDIYRIDGARVALFGHGAGAAAAQLWANRIDGPWRAVAAHGATVPTDLPQPVERGAPLRLYLGGAHPGEPMGRALARMTALARAGHAVELIRMRGHDDWFYDVGERVAADAWPWLAARMDEDER